MELDQTYVWITTRKLGPGARDEFGRAWRPSEFPEGMLRAFECYSPDSNEVVGISIGIRPSLAIGTACPGSSRTDGKRWRRS